MIAGVAWAQHRGIKKVEVRIDGGEWRPAKLADDAGLDLWRQWSYVYDGPAGRHTAQVRATDLTGETQPEARTKVFPSGGARVARDPVHRRVVAGPRVRVVRTMSDAASRDAAPEGNLTAGEGAPERSTRALRRVTRAARPVSTNGSSSTSSTAPAARSDGAPSIGEDLVALPSRHQAAELGDDQQQARTSELDAHPPTPQPADPIAKLTEPPPRQPGIDRIVTFRPRSVLVVLGVLMAVAAAIGFISRTSAGLTLIAIAVFLSLALNPAVEFFQRQGLKRPWAVIAVFTAAIGVLALLVLVFIPPMVLQVTNLVQAVPGFINRLREGNGPAGVLQRRYQVVERIQAATSGGEFTTWTSAALSGLDVIRHIATSFVRAILISFMTLFMLMEGPAWRRRLTAMLPDGSRDTVERVGSGVYRSVGGFVTGNLLASLVSGVVCVILLLVTGVPYALPLGLFVVLLNLIPYIGPTVVTVLLPLVALTQGPVRALVVFGVLLAYHVLEGHTLRPLIYGRALKLSPLAVLISIVLGTELAGILGALAAIPVAGGIQVIVQELMRRRTGTNPAVPIS